MTKGDCVWRLCGGWVEEAGTGLTGLLGFGNGMMAPNGLNKGWFGLTVGWLLGEYKSLSGVRDGQS